MTIKRKMSSSVCSTPTRQITKPAEVFQTPESQIIRDCDRMCPPAPKRLCLGLRVEIPLPISDLRISGGLGAPRARDRKRKLSFSD